MDVTWNLRSDIVWEDDTPVSADDVVFTYDTISDPEKGSWIQGIDYIDSVEKVDENTVIVHYNTIYPGYLTNSVVTGSHLAGALLRRRAGILPMGLRQ